MVARGRGCCNAAMQACEGADERHPDPLPPLSAIARTPAACYVSLPAQQRNGLYHTATAVVKCHCTLSLGPFGTIRRPTLAVRFTHRTHRATGGKTGASAPTRTEASRERRNPTTEYATRALARGNDWRHHPARDAAQTEPTRPIARTPAYSASRQSRPLARLSPAGRPDERHPYGTPNHCGRWSQCVRQAGDRRNPNQALPGRPS
jgi:hypothetical protein